MDDVRIANADVRQCLTDMGTEIGIADAKDIVGHCLGQPSADHRVIGDLYPLALCVLVHSTSSTLPSFRV